MQALRRLLFVLVLLILAVLAAVAVNQQEVVLRFMVWETPEWSVFWWLLTAFVLGTVLGFVLAFLTSFGTRVERRQLKKQVDVQNTELKKLKAEALPD